MLHIRHAFLVLVGLAAICFIGCGGSSSSNANGAINVHLVDGPIAGYQEINLNIQTVEIRGDGGWITLGTPSRTVNLLNLVGGVSESLAMGTTLPAGHYGQMRLVLGTSNTVKLSDGSVQPLTVPSGLHSGIKLVVSFDVAAGTTKDVWIDFDAAHSIQVVQAGASGQYLLRPTIWAFDKLVTGSIRGIFTDAATMQPLVGAIVYAEALDSTGAAFIARSAMTDAMGAYTLDLLPTGATYHVVSQPVTGTATPLAYGAKASDGFVLSAAMPVFTFNAAFTVAAATGGLSGGITPVASATQSDRVQLLQSLPTASGSHDFIVRTAMATVGTTTETYAFSGVPTGTYGIQGLRSTLNADGTTTSSASAALPATVTGNVTATVNLGL